MGLSKPSLGAGDGKRRADGGVLGKAAHILPVEILDGATTSPLPMHVSR